MDAALAVDTHASSRSHMISFVKDTVFSNTGKCDSTSLQRRMAFEVKAPNCGPQLFLQIIQRVTVALDVSHTLSNTIAFGLTGDKCYICIGISKGHSREQECVASKEHTSVPTICGRYRQVLAHNIELPAG